MTDGPRTPLELAAERYLQAAAEQRAILSEPEDFRPGMSIHGTSNAMRHFSHGILAAVWPNMRKAAVTDADAKVRVAMSELAQEITAEYRRWNFEPPSLRIVSNDQGPQPA